MVSKNIGQFALIVHTPWPVLRAHWLWNGVLARQLLVLAPAFQLQYIGVCMGLEDIFSIQIILTSNKKDHNVSLAESIALNFELEIANKYFWLSFFWLIHLSLVPHLYISLVQIKIWRLSEPSHYYYLWWLPFNDTSKNCLTEHISKLINFKLTKFHLKHHL